MGTPAFRACATRLRRAGAAAALLVAALATAACSDTAPRVAVGERVPAYSAATLDGSAVDLRDYRGQVVLLNVWATWCFPCRREMPAFEQLHRQLAPAGLRVVAVSVDAAVATRDIREFIDEYALGFDILHDPARAVARTFNTTGVPETFLIDADGRLLRHWIGRIDPLAPGVRDEVEAALRARPAPFARLAPTP